MTTQDLQQIKQIVQEAVQEAIVENNKNLFDKLVSKEDLKQAFIANNKNLVTKDDLILNNANLVTKDDLIRNNANLATKDDLKRALEEVEERIRLSTQKEFMAIDVKFETLEAKLSAKIDKCLSREDFFAWVDKYIVPLEIDNKKIKYLHRNEWKQLPPFKTVKKVLSLENI